MLYLYIDKIYELNVLDKNLSKMICRIQEKIRQIKDLGEDKIGKQIPLKQNIKNSELDGK